MGCSFGRQNTGLVCIALYTCTFITLRKVKNKFTFKFVSGQMHV